MSISPVRQVTGGPEDNPFDSRFGRSNRTDAEKSQQETNSGNWLKGRGYAAPVQASGTAGAPIELKTTRAADGSMTTHTPSMAAPNQVPALDAMLNQILRQRAQQPRQVLAAPAPRRDLQTAGAIPEQIQRPAAPAFGSSPANPNKDVITREVIDPQANPYHQLQTGFAPRTVRERLLPNGKWEFEDLRPQGGSGGIQGGGLGQGSLALNPNERGPHDGGMMTSQRESQMTPLQKIEAMRSMRPASNPTGMGRG